MATTIFNGVITTINLPDNTPNGLSHYYSEVMRVKKIASLLTERDKVFVILDELFKGTNAKDAFDASLLTINGFAEIKNSVFIISSHITELTDGPMAKNISLKYLEHRMINAKPEFTYQLKDGVAKNGIGMYFIANENIEALLKQAKARSFIG
jgi:DNA mismatch repair protein MutS